MIINSQSINHKLKFIGEFLILAVVFSLAYTQEPIFNSPENSVSDGNQHTKYLQGLAQAGFGFLNQDWLANTIDPLPTFSFLVKISYQLLHSDILFYGNYLILRGIYIFSLLGIANYLFNIKKNKINYIICFTVLVAIHTITIKIGAFKTSWHLQAGVALQYMLGPAFQPCNFGVFLLLSIYLFLNKRIIWSALCLAIAASFHPAYFPSIASLTLAYMIITYWQDKRWQQSLIIGSSVLVLCLPMLTYMHFALLDTTPELAQKAQDIIVNFRIPHHSIPKIWLENSKGTAYIQTVIVAIAIYLVRKSKLFLVMLIPFAIAVSLTVVLLIAKNNALSFIAPWRISVFLVPLATTIIFTQLLSFLFNKCQSILIKYKAIFFSIMLTTLTALVVVGIGKQIDLFNYQDQATKMLNFVKAQQQSGQTYLIPPDSKYLYKFRLYTGIPIFINRKSHPYKDVEVIAWYDRLLLARKFYQETDTSCQLLETELNQYSLTHIVLESEQLAISCPNLETVYQDQYYRVAAIK